MKVLTSLKIYTLPILALLCLLPFVDPGLALLMGVICSLLLGNPYAALTEKLPKTLLAYCVIGLGGAMNLHMVLVAGSSGFLYTIIGITLTLALGLILARVFNVGRESGLLITVGTAICGGSAIAAIAPIIQARSSAIALSLAVVFILNALALLVFPPIGHALDLTQHQFGLWAALAIHDTSSVVGAGMQYGPEALQSATSIKLARALWIVPLVFAVQALYKPTEAQDGEVKVKRKYPWFILGFLALAAIVTYMPVLKPVGEMIAFAARRGLVLALFIIGTNINAGVMKEVGLRPLIMGAALWLAVSIATLGAIMAGLIG